LGISIQEIFLKGPSLESVYFDYFYPFTRYLHTQFFINGNF